MLSYVWQNADGERRELENVLTARLAADADVPADEIVLTAPYDERLKSAAEIYAYDGGKLVFEGIVDEILGVVNSSGAIMKLSGRSRAGLLLDNEAQPITYVNPAAGMIFARHLEPFGIKSFDGDKRPYYGKLKIEKGMSHWQVLEKFCEGRYSCSPRITGDGRALMTGAADDGETLIFGGGIAYTELKEDVLPCKVISEVRLRLDEYGGYKSVLKNKSAPQSAKRIRYVNAAENGAMILTADKMIENGNKNSLKITLGCAGCVLAEPGRRAVVRDNTVGEIDGLVVKSLKYSLAQSGESTTVTLGKEEA